MINGSVTGSALNQIPLVNSTQILTQSAQVPMTASTPIVGAPTTVMANPVAAPGTPGLIVNSPNIVSNTSQIVPEDDYRLGRGILDDFRPGGYKSVVGSTVVVGNNVPITNPKIAVPTPIVSSGTGSLQDFL
jgi:hypothetical protein